MQPVILVGVGNLGLALLSYRGFAKEGFEIVAAFDAETRRKRDKEIRQPIYGMDECRSLSKGKMSGWQFSPSPPPPRRKWRTNSFRAGITGILNFSPIVLSVPEEVMVNNVNLAIELENLSYFTQE